MSTLEWEREEKRRELEFGTNLRWIEAGLRLLPSDPITLIFFFFFLCSVGVFFTSMEGRLGLSLLRKKADEGGEGWEGSI